MVHTLLCLYQLQEFDQNLWLIILASPKQFVAVTIKVTHSSISRSCTLTAGYLRADAYSCNDHNLTLTASLLNA